MATRSPTPFTDIESAFAEIPRAWWMMLGGVVAAMLLVMVVTRAWPPSMRERLEQASIELGLTPERREAMTLELAAELVKLEKAFCSESRRRTVGALAVEYFETVVEKPIAALALAVGRPQQLPPDWVAERPRAVLTQLALAIRRGQLSSDELTGTLAEGARPWAGSQLHHV
jgi:hypothetical protein